MIHFLENSTRKLTKWHSKNKGGCVSNKKAFPKEETTGLIDSVAPPVLFNVWKIRHEFPMLQQHLHGKPFIYLDSAATTQKPRCVIDAMSRFYQDQYGTVHRSVYDFASQATTRYNNVRQKVKEFLNAAFVEEIIFTKGTTESINLVASSFGKAFLQPGDEVLITVMEHHSNIVPWQMICEERGAHLKAVPINEQGELILEEFEKLLSDRTKIVSVAHIANSTGTLNPIEDIIKLSHAKGAKVLIDGAQSIAHMPIDVQKLKADFYVFSGHKAYGPTGVGVLYGKRSLLEKMPPYQGGGDMIDEVTLSSSTYQHPPLKFEAGTPMIAEVIGLGEALDFIERLGRDKIAAWEQSLLEYATKRMSEVKGLRIIGTAAHKSSIISFVVAGLHPLDIGTLLDLRGIAVRTGQLCAQPTLDFFNVSSLTRISFGLHNTLEEIDVFVETLKEVILLLRPSMSY
jgi:cysteine desulfurase / selenocysteine lyase